jgi:hypothetical protein
MEDIENAGGARELLDRMSKDYAASQAAGLAEATRLAEKEALAQDAQVARISADDATARIDAHMADNSFVKKWMSGDVEAVKAMQILHRAKVENPSTAEQLLAGSAPDGAFQVGIPTRDKLAMVENFRDEGLGDEEITHVFRETPVSRAEHTAARRAKEQLLADPAWVAALLSGHPAAKRDLHRLSFILASPIQEGA